MNRKTLPKKPQKQYNYAVWKASGPAGSIFSRNESENYGWLRNGKVEMSLLLELSEELECAECSVLCEKVIYPANCFNAGCKYIYSYDEGRATYFGCLYKVFAVEIDLGGFKELEKRKGGFGAVKVVRPPLDRCQITVERAYNREQGDTCRRALAERYTAKTG